VAARQGAPPTPASGSIAEDSGCLEFDCWEWKYLLWPADDDITIPMLETGATNSSSAANLSSTEVDAKEVPLHPLVPQARTTAQPGLTEFLPRRRGGVDPRIA